MPARIATAVLPLVALLAGCTHLPLPSPGERTADCATAEASIAFDFAGASTSQCVIEGPRAFALVIAPEHAPPINPSPWYAFRYTATPGDPVRVRLDYLHASHRYAPKLTKDGIQQLLPVDVTAEGRSATIMVPTGSGTISAQPIVDAEDHARFAVGLVNKFSAERVILGQSHDGRSIEAIRIGDPAARRLIVILGRQHPPEVTGSYALEPFVEELAAQLKYSADAEHLQLLVVPLLNPDGVERGHWRANRGGVDLNRDWGPFTQPETRAVRDWLAREEKVTTPIAMIDFHSTNRNLFYVQGDEASAVHQRFLTAWLGGKESAYPGYFFTIERRNRNPGSGTAKNWFFEKYSIPSYTYEVSDEADPVYTAQAARELSRKLSYALKELN